MAKSKTRRWRSLLYMAIAGLALALYLESRPFISYPQTVISGSLAASQIRSTPVSNTDHAMAGMAVVDITPGIGLPKFGYSAWAKPADGFRTRLKARAFYLRGTDGTTLALVQLDLGVGSLVLHHRVAELIAEKTDIPAHGLSLLVTHTHTGPGGFLDSDFYNVYGGNQAGFDPVLFEFLSTRIADAVISAYKQQRPARIASGQREVWGLTRNRSVGAWAENFNLAASTINEALAFRAVNPQMTMLRIDLQADDGQFYPAGALTAFSIHGTSIPAFTGPYHADIWAWLAGDVEQALQASGTPFNPVHGAFQGTHADNNPAWHQGERGDFATRRIGKALAQQAIALHQQLAAELDDQLTLQRGSRLVNTLTLNEDARFGLCERAVVGAATIGAANGDEVFPISYLPYFKKDWPRRFFNHGCQGEKQWMLSKLQLLLPADRFPHKALLQVLRVNDLIIVTAPWEVTLEAGNQIRDAVKAALPNGNWHIEISSLANGMFGYVTTPAEYRRQYYEGGHTLYGPHSLTFLRQQFSTLTATLVANGELNDIPEDYRFRLATRSYWPDTPASEVSRRWLTEPEFVRGAIPVEPHWRIKLLAEPPGHLELHLPLLSIENSTGTVVVDDQSGDLQLRLVRDNGDSGHYEVRWFYPVLRPDEQHRLIIAPRDERPALISDWF